MKETEAEAMAMGEARERAGREAERQRGRESVEGTGEVGLVMILEGRGCYCRGATRFKGRIAADVGAQRERREERNRERERERERGAESCEADP